VCEKCRNSMEKLELVCQWDKNKSRVGSNFTVSRTEEAASVLRENQRSVGNMSSRELKSVAVHE